MKSDPLKCNQCTCKCVTDPATGDLKNEIQCANTPGVSCNDPTVTLSDWEQKITARFPECIKYDTTEQTCTECPTKKWRCDEFDTANGCDWKCQCQIVDPVKDCKPEDKKFHQCDDLAYVKTQYPECFVERDQPEQANCNECPATFCSCNDLDIANGCDWKCGCKNPKDCSTVEEQGCADELNIKVNYPKCWVEELIPARRSCDACPVKKCYCNADDVANNCHIHCAKPTCPDTIKEHDCPRLAFIKQRYPECHVERTLPAAPGKYPNCPEKFCECNSADVANGCDWKCSCKPENGHVHLPCPDTIKEVNCGTQLQLDHPQCFSTTNRQENCCSCPEKECYCDSTKAGCADVCSSCDIKECPDKVIETGCEGLNTVKAAFPECIKYTDTFPLEPTCTACPARKCYCDVDNVAAGCDWKCKCMNEHDESEIKLKCDDPATLVCPDPHGLKAKFPECWNERIEPSKRTCTTCPSKTGFCDESRTMLNCHNKCKVCTDEERDGCTDLTFVKETYPECHVETKNPAIGDYGVCPKTTCSCDLANVAKGCDWKCQCKEGDKKIKCPDTIEEVGCDAAAMQTHPQCFRTVTSPEKETCTDCPKKTCSCDASIAGCKDVCEPCKMGLCPPTAESTEMCNKLVHIATKYPECYTENTSPEKPQCIDDNTTICPKRNCACNSADVANGCDWKCTCDPNETVIEKCGPVEDKSTAAELVLKAKYPECWTENIFNSPRTCSKCPYKQGFCDETKTENDCHIKCVPCVTCIGAPVEHECTKLRHIDIAYPECFEEKMQPETATCHACPEKYCRCKVEDVANGCDWKCKCTDADNKPSCPAKVAEHASCDAKVYPSIKSHPECWTNSVLPTVLDKCNDCPMKHCSCNKLTPGCESVCEPCDILTCDTVNEVNCDAHNKFGKAKYPECYVSDIQPASPTCHACPEKTCTCDKQNTANACDIKCTCLENETYIENCPALTEPADPANIQATYPECWKTEIRPAMRTCSECPVKYGYCDKADTANGCDVKCAQCPKDCPTEPEQDVTCSSAKMNYIRSHYKECFRTQLNPLTATCTDCPKRNCFCDSTDVENNCAWKCACADQPDIGPCDAVEQVDCTPEFWSAKQGKYSQCFTITEYPTEETCYSCPRKECKCDRSISGCDVGCDCFENKKKSCPDVIPKVNYEQFKHIEAAYPECIKKTTSVHDCENCPETTYECDSSKVDQGCDWKCFCDVTDKPMPPQCPLKMAEENCQDPNNVKGVKAVCWIETIDYGNKCTDCPVKKCSCNASDVANGCDKVCACQPVCPQVVEIDTDSCDNNTVLNKFPECKKTITDPAVATCNSQTGLSNCPKTKCICDSTNTDAGCDWKCGCDPNDPIVTCPTPPRKTILGEQSLRDAGVFDKAPECIQLAFVRPSKATCSGCPVEFYTCNKQDTANNCDLHCDFECPACCPDSVDDCPAFMKPKSESVSLMTYAPAHITAREAEHCGNCLKKTCECDRDSCVEPSGCEECQTLVTKWDDNNCCKIKDRCEDPCNHNGVTYPYGSETQESTTCKPCICTERDGVKDVFCTDKTKAPYCNQTPPACPKTNDKGFACRLVNDGYADMDNCCPKQKCECDSCADTDCAIQYPGIVLEPLCEDGYKLDVGTYLDSDTKCCLQRKCIKDCDNCVSVPKLSTDKCNECCKQNPNYCSEDSTCIVSWSCDCSNTVACDLGNGIVKSYADTWNEENDVCRPCVCRKDGTAHCENKREAPYCELKAVSCANLSDDECCVLKKPATDTDCCNVWGKEPKTCQKRFPSLKDNKLDDCIKAYPDSYPAPNCDDGYMMLDEGSDLDDEGCCQEFKCKCKDSCPSDETLKAKISCNLDKCEYKLSPNTHQCGCNVWTCECPPNKCIFEGDEYALGTQFYGKGNDGQPDNCRPCTCHPDGTATCVNYRTKCAMDGYITDPNHQTKPGYKLLKVANYKAPPTLETEVCCCGYQEVCDDVDPAVCQVWEDQGKNIKPIQFCPIGKKPWRKLLSGSPECGGDACYEWGCECDYSKCKDVIATYGLEKCVPGCKKIKVAECDCEYYRCDPECPKKHCEYTDNNGNTIAIENGKQFFLNNDQCRPCTCDTSSDDVNVWCPVDKRTECSNPNCVAPNVRYEIDSTECCTNYACCDSRCPSEAQCETKHGPLREYPKGMDHCPDGMHWVSQGKLESIKDPKGKEKITCCEKFKCECKPTCENVPNKPTCDIQSGKCQYKETKDACGCVTSYTCECFDCKDEKTGTTYTTGQIWDKEGDACHTCCCTDNGEINCNNRRVEPLCQPSLFQGKDISVNPNNCPAGYTRKMITPSDIKTIHAAQDDATCCPKYTCECTDSDICTPCTKDCSAYPYPTCTKSCHQPKLVAKHCDDPEETCCCEEYKCQVNPALIHCPETPPDCPCYTTTVSEEECGCPTYECKPLEECICGVATCDNTGKQVTCDYENTSVVAGKMWFKDAEKCKAIKCTCEGKIEEANLCNNECLEKEPICGVGCCFDTCNPLAEQNGVTYNKEVTQKCLSYGRCNCPTCPAKDQQCRVKILNQDATKCVGDNKWYKDAEKCITCECIMQDGKATENCVDISDTCQDISKINCEARGLVAKDNYDNCCPTRTCVCKGDDECPTFASPTCILPKVIGQELVKYLDNEAKCPCYKDVCTCPPNACQPINCPDGQEKKLKDQKDECGCDILDKCYTPVCTLSDEFAEDSVDFNTRVYKINDVDECYPYICKCNSDGTNSLEVDTDLQAKKIPTPCILNKNDLTACADDEKKNDVYNGCCWTRTCTPAKCGPLNTVVCSDYEKEVTVVKNTITCPDTGEKITCYKKECQCDCPKVDTCTDECYTEEYETVNAKCGCQALKACVRDTQKCPVLNECVDHEGCLRDLGETWYHNGDNCHTCQCLENGLVSCNDRSTLCMDVPSCLGGELLVAYSCDTCCLNYKCIVDECYDVCGVIHQPCCQEHEKVIEITRTLENGCKCPEFKCVCDPDKCPEYNLDDMNCGCDDCYAHQPAGGDCDGTEDGGNNCPPAPVCKCKVQMCPNVDEANHKCPFLTPQQVCGDNKTTKKCNGLEWVDEKDCKCKTASGWKKPGETWPEGCNTCKCINGRSECSLPPCPVTEADCKKQGKSCKLVKDTADQCCGTCSCNEQVCLHQNGIDHMKCDSTWTHNCMDCTCEERKGETYGFNNCKPVTCGKLDKDNFTCTEACHKPVEKTAPGACCPHLECECDKTCCPTAHISCSTQCVYNNDNTYSIAYKTGTPQWITKNDGDCCSTSTCVWDTTQCETKDETCKDGKKWVRTDEVEADGCCSKWKQVECVCQYNNQVYSVGKEFPHKDDNCRVCKCLEDLTINDCPRVTCPAIEKPTCADGSEPKLVPSTDVGSQCCNTWVCDCICSGTMTETLSIKTFDGESLNLPKYATCHRYLTKHSCGNKDFEIYVDLQGIENSAEVVCQRSVSQEYFIFKDNKNSRTYKLQNTKFYIDSTEYDLVTDTNLNIPNQYDIKYIGENQVIFNWIEMEIIFKFTPATGAWSLKLEDKYIGKTTGYCGTCDNDSDNEQALLIKCSEDQGRFVNAPTEKLFIKNMRHPDWENRDGCKCGTCGGETGPCDTPLCKCEDRTPALGNGEKYDTTCGTCECVCDKFEGAEEDASCHTIEAKTGVKTFYKCETCCRSTIDNSKCDGETCPYNHCEYNNIKYDIGFTAIPHETDKCKTGTCNGCVSDIAWTTEVCKPEDNKYDNDAVALNTHVCAGVCAPKDDSEFNCQWKKDVTSNGCCSTVSCNCECDTKTCDDFIDNNAPVKKCDQVERWEDVAIPNTDLICQKKHYDCANASCPSKPDVAVHCQAKPCKTARLVSVPAADDCCCDWWNCEYDDHDCANCCENKCHYNDQCYDLNAKVAHKDDKCKSATCLACDQDLHFVHKVCKAEEAKYDTLASAEAHICPGTCETGWKVTAKASDDGCCFVAACDCQPCDDVNCADLYDNDSVTCTCDMTHTMEDRAHGKGECATTCQEKVCTCENVTCPDMPTLATCQPKKCHKAINIKTIPKANGCCCPTYDCEYEYDGVSECCTDQCHYNGVFYDVNAEIPHVSDKCQVAKCVACCADITFTDIACLAADKKYSTEAAALGHICTGVCDGTWEVSVSKGANECCHIAECTCKPPCAEETCEGKFDNNFDCSCGQVAAFEDHTFGPAECPITCQKKVCNCVGVQCDPAPPVEDFCKNAKPCETATLETVDALDGCCCPTYKCKYEATSPKPQCCEDVCQYNNQEYAILATVPHKSDQCQTGTCISCANGIDWTSRNCAAENKYTSVAEAEANHVCTGTCNGKDSWQINTSSDGCCITATCDCEPYTGETCDDIDNSEVCTCDKAESWSTVKRGKCDCQLKECSCENVTCTDYTLEDATKLCDAKPCHTPRLVSKPAATGCCCPTYECEYDQDTDECCDPDDLADKVCNEIMSQDYLKDCANFIDTRTYLNKCKQEYRKACKDGTNEWTETRTVKAACDVIAAFAQECSDKLGICKNDWRDARCPYNCTDNKQYKACGPTVEKNCDNKKHYETILTYGEIKFTQEGCFCPDDKVLQDGKCVDCTDCHGCFDDDGKPIPAGDWWWSSTDKCIRKICHCEIEGKVVTRDLREYCDDSYPTECSAGYTLKDKMDERGCCQIRWCEANTCTAYRTANCPDLDIAKLDNKCENMNEVYTVKFADDDTNKCCPMKHCEPKEEPCPFDPYKDPTCNSWETLWKSDPSKECCCKKCICDTAKCTTTLAEYEANNCGPTEKAVLVNNDHLAYGRGFEKWYFEIFSFFRLLLGLF